MDTSNPVLPQDRRSIAEMRENQRLRRRQDLGYLQEITRAAPRYHLSVGSSPLAAGETKALFGEFVASRIKEVSRLKDEPLPTKVLRKLEDSMPICGIITAAGLPLHPAAVNNSKGNVSVRRMMGGVPGVPDGLNDMISILGERVLGAKSVYTAGTWKGFVTRIEQQMGRATVPMAVTYQKVYGLKKPATFSVLAKMLDKQFPMTPSDWPSLSSDLDEHLDRLSITASSSAGAPYWRNKGEVIDDVLLEGLPRVVAAIKESRVDKLFRENPELFLCEVKNKMDRYDIAKLDEKTRPYCCVPAHWALLFSVLTQKFQEGLQVFTSGGGVNAYGFSAANGGLEKMVEWMYSADKKGKYICYGDDTCLVVRKGDDIYRVDPDFKQMDGSLDARDISLVCDYVLAKLCKEEGPDFNPSFWEEVVKIWGTMACDPTMIIDGTEIYEKVSPNGMMSGVPGTTLFDTFKSAVSWRLYLDDCSMRGLNVLDEGNVTRFMKDKCGLVIKPGTWVPEVLPKRLQPGMLVSTHKFLGVQILMEEYEGKPVFVPTIPLDDAVEMLVVQKDNPFEKTISRLGRARRLYDRCRGLFITFGFTHPEIVDAIHHVVNNIDPVAIVMCTQVLGGEKPEALILEDFAYPDSSGFPTVEYCKSLYSSDVTREGEWQQIFPTLAPILANLRSESRLVEQKVKKIKNIGEHERIVVETIKPEEPEPPKEFSVLEKKGKAQTYKIKGDHNTRSKIEQQGTEKPFLPNLVMSIRAILRRLGVIKVSTVKKLTGAGEKAIENAIVDGGFFCTDLKNGEISLLPMVTAAATAQEDLYREAQSHTTVNSNTKFIQAMKATKDSGEVADMRVEDLFLDPQFLMYVPELPAVDTIGDALCQLPVHLVRGTPISSMRWKTTAVTVGGANPVTLEMQVQVHDSWVCVASCRGLNKKICQSFIVRAFWEAKGPSIGVDAFSVKKKEETSDWAEEMEQEMSPYLEPQPTYKKDESETDSLIAKLLSVGGSATYMVLAIDTFLEQRKAGVEIEIATELSLQIFSDLSEGRGISVPPPRPLATCTPSASSSNSSLESNPEPGTGKWHKRQRGTPEKRKKNNRRLKERKRRAKQRASLSPN